MRKQNYFIPKPPSICKTRGPVDYSKLSTPLLNDLKAIADTNIKRNSADFLGTDLYDQQKKMKAIQDELNKRDPLLKVFDSPKPEDRYNPFS
jgi:hypothetical protein